MSIEEIKAAIKAKEKEWQFAVEAHNAEIRALEMQLIEAVTVESGLKPGDRVKVMNARTPKYGIFGGYRIKYGHADPIIYKEKKDGTASKLELYAYRVKIEKA